MMRRITHNAHVFIIRPFVQLFWCSLVLFCFAFFSCFVRSACFLFCFSLGLLLFALSVSLFRFCSLLYLLLLFLFRNVCWSCLFTVADFRLVPKCGCVFRFALYFFVISLWPPYYSFPFRFFSFLCLICFQFKFILSDLLLIFVLFSTLLVSITHFSLFSFRTITRMRRMWIDPFACFSRSGLQNPQEWCETDECITILLLMHHRQTDVNANKLQQIKCEMFRLQLRMQLNIWAWCKRAEGEQQDENVTKNENKISHN